jgi:lysophospholipid acyltransferase 7
VIFNIFHRIDESTNEFNFETIRNIYIYETETCWTFREAMKKWNTCVQYWLAMYVYKRFPSKKFRYLLRNLTLYRTKADCSSSNRTFATLAVSAFWHGVHPGYYFCILGAPFYVPIEDMYNKLFRNEATGLTRRILDVACWISKFFAFSYMGIAFLLLSIDKILYYYSSVYYCGYLLWAVMFGVGTLLSLQKKTMHKKSERTPPTTTTGENNKKVE